MMGTGRIHMYYGDGKGKTTAAVGQAVRAAGYGLQVLFFQFLKDNSSNERKILEAVPGITCLPGRDQVKFVSRMNGDEKAELRHYNNKALDEIVKFCTNKIPYNFNIVSANEYFNDCADDLSVELAAQNVGFGYFNYVEKNVRIIADPEQVKRVIHNIVNNSLKYMDKPKGMINLRVKDVGDFVQIELEDNGKGIAAKDLPNIFDRFYRTDASRNSSTGGSGIGLSVVKKIVEEHGGKIWATSREETGTTMYFVLRKYQEVPVNE